jgi:hypothetical protein
MTELASKEGRKDLLTQKIGVINSLSNSSLGTEELHSQLD